MPTSYHRSRFEMVGTLPPSLVELRQTSRFAHPTVCEWICLARKRNLDA